MRTFVLAFAALLASTSVLAQSTVTPSVSSVGASTDELAQQKRQLSGELKNTLGMAEGLAKRAMTLASTTSGQEHDKHMKTADDIKNIQIQLTDQLGLVNRATAENSAAAFTTAKDVLSATKTALEEHKKALGNTATK